jgi:murein L,D-transpeptidase YafK
MSRAASGAISIVRHHTASRSAYRFATVPAGLALAVALFSAPGAGAAPAHASDDGVRIEVSKSDKQLLVWQDGQVVRRFHIAYGKGGAGKKQKLGDNKTPVGVYRIVEFKSDSRFHFFMQIDYPNLLDAWHGYRTELIDAGQFRAIATAHRDSGVPPQDTALGGYIGIHGIGETNEEKLDIHEYQNWTDGCIALTNEEVSELRRFVGIGTRVVIRE